MESGEDENVADCFAVVGEIQSLLVASHGADPLLVASLAAEFNACAQTAARRLNECCDSINKGQNAHAIFLADTWPVLLDLISALDFPGVQRWYTLAAQHGAPPATAFNVRMIQQLQDAYTSQEALEPLQKMYRLLALKGASAQEKLGVLRRIRKLDPSNAHWSQDIAALETVRVREIGDDFAARCETLNEIEAGAMLKELTRSDLSVKPDEALVQSLRTAYLNQKTGRVHAAMAGLISRLNDGFAVRDFAVVNGNLNDLDAMRQFEQVDWPSQDSKIIRDARAWRSEQLATAERHRAFHQKLQHFEKLLSDEAEPNAVRESMRTFEANDATLPAELAERANTYLNMHASKQRRARLRKTALLTLAAIIVLGVGAVIFLKVQETRQRAAFVVKIRSAAAALNFADGDRAIARLKSDAPRMLDDATIKAELAEFQQAKSADAQRSGELKALLERGSGMGPFDPGMDAVLDQAEKLARTAEEADAVTEWKMTVALKRAERSKSAGAEALSLVSSAERLLSAIKLQDQPEALNAAVAELDSVLRKAESLHGLPQDVTEQVKRYRTKLSAEQNRATQLKTKAEAARAMLATMREQLPAGVKNYAEDLARRRDEFASVSVAFRDASKWEPTAPAYAAAGHWNEHASALLRKSPGAPQEMGTHAFKAFSDWASAHEHFGEAPSPYCGVLLKQMARADFYAKSQDNLLGLRNLLAHDLTNKLREFTVIEGAKSIRYYTHDKAEIKEAGGDAVECEVFSDDAMTLDKRLFPRGSFGKITVSAHVTLAREVSRLIESDASAPGWTSRIPQAIRLANDASQADPYVRALILNKLLALDAGHVHALALPPELVKKVSDMCGEKISFWKPGDDVVRVKLDAIAAALKTLQPALAQSVNAYDADREKAEIQALFRPLAMSAVAAVGDAGALTVSALPGQLPQKEYWIIDSADGGEFVFKIAAITDEGGAVRWMDGVTVATGQPLLSPRDGVGTMEMVQKKGAGNKTPPPPFPVNVDALKK